MYTVLPLYVTLYFDLQCTHFPTASTLPKSHFYLSMGISSSGNMQPMPALLTTATRGRGTLARRWRTGARAARSFCTLLYAAASDASSVTSIRTYEAKELSYIGRSYYCWQAAAAWEAAASSATGRVLASHSLPPDERTGTSVSMPSARSLVISDSCAVCTTVAHQSMFTRVLARTHIARGAHLAAASVHNEAFLGECERRMPPDARRGARHDDAAALVHRVLLARSEQHHLVQNDKCERKQRRAQHRSGSPGRSCTTRLIDCRIVAGYCRR